MYKHAVIDLLNEYSVLKRKANFSWKRAKELKQKLAEIENEGVIYEEIYNEYLECCRDYYKAQKAVSETEYYLSFLEYEERTALEYFYINRGPRAADRLCMKLSVETSTAYRIKDRAIKKMIMYCFGAGKN